MAKKLFAVFMLLAIAGTACSAKKEIVLEKQSFVRWHERDNSLEVYAAVANATGKPAVFEARVVLLSPGVKESVGFGSRMLETDDRGGVTPFRLEPHQETVFVRHFATDRALTRDMLSKGIGIQITTSKDRYILPIPYGDIE